MTARNRLLWLLVYVLVAFTTFAFLALSMQVVTPPMLGWSLIWPLFWPMAITYGGLL